MVYPGIEDEVNGFEISDTGELRNVKTGNVYKKELLRSGYYSVRVTLGSRKRKKHIIIHKAVAYAFLGGDGEEVNHIDGDKTNNNVDNLEWCTNSENLFHAWNVINSFDRERYIGENNPAHKLSEDDVRNIRLEKINGASERSLSRKYKVSRPVIHGILNGYWWKYVN